MSKKQREKKEVRPRTVWTIENIQKFLDENTDGIKFISKEYIDKGYQNCLYVDLLLPDGTTGKSSMESIPNKRR